MDASDSTGQEPSPQSEHIPSTEGPDQPTSATPLDKERCQEQDAEDCSDTFQPECELSLEGGQDLQERFKNCKKKPGHTKFIPITKFFELVNEKSAKNPVRAVVDRTVKVSLTTISSKRPSVFDGTCTPYPYGQRKGRQALRCGTGFVTDVKVCKPEDCTCQKSSDSPGLGTECVEISVYTASHVVYDTEEAKDCVFEFFYDTEDDKSGVKTLRGTSASSVADTDMTFIKCYTHDKELVDKIGMGDNGVGVKTGMLYSRSDVSFIVSHPHGCSKQISIGTLQMAGRATRVFFPPAVTQYRLPNHRGNSQGTAHPGEKTHSDEGSHEPEWEYYNLPRGARWIIPKVNGEEFHLQMQRFRMNAMFIYGNYFFSHISVPPGTLIELPGGEQVPCPEDAELRAWDLIDHLLYDISTCPGSSGAPICCILDQKLHMSLAVCHSGSEGGTNRSSLSGLLSF